MKVILIDIWESMYPSLGLGYLAAYAEKYGNYNEIYIIDNKDNIINKIRKIRPNLIGFRSVTPNYKETVNIARKIKEEFDIPILIGGPHITSIPTFLDPIFDIGAIGEAEETFLEILNLYKKKKSFPKEDLKLVDGIVFHDGPKRIITNPRKYIEDLDKIPHPKFELFDKEKYFKPNDILCDHKFYIGTNIMTSRGCPYKCIYCQAAKQWGRVRLHSAEYVVEEIKILHKKYNVNGIAIIDDLFIVSKKRVEKIVELLEKENLLGKIKFLVCGRANLINDQILFLLKKMGVIQISIGFETGSDRLLKYLKKDSVTIKQNVEAAKLIKKYGIRVYGLFMLGSPTETKNEMIQTINFFKKLDIDTASITITCPLPGTEMWNELYSKGKVNYNMDWNLFMNPVYEPEKQIYVNENVTHKDFIKIYHEFQNIMIAKGLGDKKTLFTIDMIKKAVKHPKLALNVGMHIIKSKAVKFIGR